MTSIHVNSLYYDFVLNKMTKDEKLVLKRDFRI